MTASEALHFFIAAVQAVVPGFDGREERIEISSGQELWDWCLGGDPIPGMLVADLSDEQQATVKQVLDGMIRERSNGTVRPSSPRG